MADNEPRMDGPPEPGEERKNMNYPLVRFSEIPEDTTTEILDTITGSVERYINDLEMACKAIKEEMDRLYDPQWHVVIGEAFGFDVTYQTKHIMYLFFMGNLSILVWKCN